VLLLLSAFAASPARLELSERIQKRKPSWVGGPSRRNAGQRGVTLAGQA
jgi:hypothetical protein